MGAECFCPSSLLGRDGGTADHAPGTVLLHSIVGDDRVYQELWVSLDHTGTSHYRIALCIHD